MRRWLRERRIARRLITVVQVHSSGFMTHDEAGREARALYAALPPIKRGGR